MESEHTKIYFDGDGNATGKVNILGVDVKIADILGKSVIEQFMASLTKEDIDVIHEGCKKILFNVEYGYKEGSISEREEYRVLKIKQTVGGGRWGSKDEYTPIAQVIKDEFGQYLSKDIKKYVEEYVKTDEYKEYCEKIAKEIMDYATEGWKKEMMDTIRRKLIGDNVDHVNYKYSGISIVDTVNSIIDQRVHL